MAIPPCLGRPRFRSPQFLAPQFLAPQFLSLGVVLLTIEYQCPACDSKLRVASEHVGQHTRCPHCGALHWVQLPRSEATEIPSAPRPDTVAETRNLESDIQNSQDVGIAVEPHRGVLVLTLAISGFLCSCPVLSIVAWVMGAADLAKMHEGTMDASGMDFTKSGYYLGMIFSLAAITLSAIVGMICLLRVGM